MFGDLVFYGKNEKSISHVAICLDDLLMFEAGGGNSRTTNRDKAQEHGAWVRVRPIKSRKRFNWFWKTKIPVVI